MNNDFFIQDYSDPQGMQGFGQMFKSIIGASQRRKEQEQQDAEYKRVLDYRRAQSQAFGVDPDTGELMQGFQVMQPQGQQMPNQMQGEQIPMQDQFQAPVETPEEANARMAQELKDHIVDPNAARDEKMALDEIGITPDKYGEVKTFANEIKRAPDEEVPAIITKRIQTIVARGGDAKDTASLLAMPPEEAKRTVSAVGMIVDTNALRKMYALDPVATQRIIDSSVQKGGETDFTRRMTQFEQWRNMPEGTDKEKKEKNAFGMLVGVVPRGRSAEEAIAVAGAVEGIKTEEQKKRDNAQAAIDVNKAEKIEGIKTNAEIIRDTRKAEETPQGKADMAKKNAELIALRSAEEAKAYDGQDSLDLVDTLMSSDLNKIYGRGESVYPELLRSQKGIDMLSQRDRLIATIKMAARGQLKGQGAVSDSDAKMLGDSVTLLGNPNISDAAAKAELARVREAIARTMASAQSTGAEVRKAVPNTQAPAATTKTGLTWKIVK